VAISNSGYKFPSKKVIVNLAPASLRKKGTAFDLPIALAVLAASLGDGAERGFGGDWRRGRALGGLRGVPGALSMAEGREERV
jgi:magnesium chelatase family protein